MTLTILDVTEMKKGTIKFPIYAYRVGYSDNGGGSVQHAFTADLPEPRPNLTATGEQIGFTGFATGYGICGFVCCIPKPGESVVIEGDYLVLRSPSANPGTEGWQYSANDCVRFERDYGNGRNRLWYAEKNKAYKAYKAKA